MENIKYMDISLTKNRNTVAATFAHLFSYEEIEELFSFDNLELRDDSSEKFYQIACKNFGNDKKIQINEIILSNAPFNKFIDLRIFINESYQIDFKFKYDYNISKYFIFIVASALNYKKYGDRYDSTYIKKHIFVKYAKVLSKRASIESLLELKREISNSMLLDSNIENNVNIDLEADNIRYRISVFKTNMIKFSFTDAKTKKQETIYFMKNKIGISYIPIIIEQSIMFKEK